MGLWSIVGGAIGSIIEPGAGTAAGAAIGGLIDSSTQGGGSTSSNAVGGYSSAGAQAYVNNTKRSGPYPSTQQLLQALQAQGDKDTGLLNAIQSNYNQATGYAKYGDWDILVINTNPITIEQFKGASETYTTRTAASLAAFAAPAAGGTSIATPNIQAGPATNAVFPPVSQPQSGAMQVQSLGPAQSAANNGTPPPNNTQSFWQQYMWWIIGGVVGFFMTIVLLFVALKPKRR